MNKSEETVHLRKYLTGIIGSAPFGVVTMSANHEVGIINRNAVELLGFSGREPHELIDRGYRDAFANIPELLDTYCQLVDKQKKLHANLDKVQLKNCIANIRIRPLFNGSLVIIEDITVQAVLENLLIQQASHNTLTALANRHQFEEKTTAAIDKAILHKLPGAIIFIDLYRFKSVNDTAGRAAGDELLKRVAFLLNQVVRLGEFNFFSLNDFGSGLSSFTYLKNLPVDYLKIDGSFVRDIDNDKVSYAMVKSINEIGHAMGLKTIAERVENKAILTRLKKIGVDFAQGYHIHKPKPLIVPANAKPA